MIHFMYVKKLKFLVPLSISIQYKGFAGSRWGTYFYIKNDDDPISVILTGNKFALKHVSLMHMCNNIKTKAGLFQQYILCLVLLQKKCSQNNRKPCFLFSKHQWCKKM